MHIMIGQSQLAGSNFTSEIIPGLGRSLQLFKLWGSLSRARLMDLQGLNEAMTGKLLTQFLEHSSYSTNISICWELRVIIAHTLHQFPTWRDVRSKRHRGKDQFYIVIRTTWIEELGLVKEHHLGILILFSQVRAWNDPYGERQVFRAHTPRITASRPHDDASWFLPRSTV